MAPTFLAFFFYFRYHHHSIIALYIHPCAHTFILQSGVTNFRVYSCQTLSFFLYSLLLRPHHPVFTFTCHPFELHPLHRNVFMLPDFFICTYTFTTRILLTDFTQVQKSRHASHSHLHLFPKNLPFHSFECALVKGRSNWVYRSDVKFVYVLHL